MGHSDSRGVGGALLMPDVAGVAISSKTLDALEETRD